MITMKNLLQEKNCYLRDGVRDWRDAIHVACAPLIKQRYCTKEYEKAIFASTKQFGPYYVLCENLALIHASNTCGVLGTQMAVTLLKKPVRFKENGYDVRVLVTLVSKDTQAHMEGIQAISNIFMNEQNVQKILHASNAREIYALFISNANSNTVSQHDKEE